MNTVDIVRLTKYEKTRILGVRAEQLSNGAKPLVDTKGLVNPLIIAEKEYLCGKIPLDIIRTLPDETRIKIVINETLNK